MLAQYHLKHQQEGEENLLTIQVSSYADPVPPQASARGRGEPPHYPGKQLCWPSTTSSISRRARRTSSLSRYLVMLAQYHLKHQQEGEENLLTIQVSNYAARPPVPAVFRIHDILVWIRIRGSMPLTNGSGSCYFRHWPSRYQQKTTNFLTQFFLLVTFWKYH